MFTGIVQTKGRVASLDHNDFRVRLGIDGQGWPDPKVYQPQPGDSISVSGVCLTVVEATGGVLMFDVIAETLAKTTLGDLTPGDEVNLEPPVTVNQPLGGHFMQGHVDGVGIISEVKSSKDEWRVRVQPPAALMRYMIPKGSVAIDGVSLTLADVGKDDIEVALIPTTLEITTLGQSAPGRKVNLEADIISKTIAHQLEQMLARPGSSSGIDRQTLINAGFIKEG